MTLQEIGIVCAICTPLVTASAVGGKLYGDAHIWVSAADYNSTELEKIQRDKRLLEFDQQNGTITPRGELELHELRDMEQRLLLKLQ